MADLPVPVSLLKTEVSAQWETGNVVAPTFIEVNVSAQSLRYDLNVKDALLFRAGTPSITEEPIGNRWEFVNRIYNVELELSTQVSRQRLYNMVQEVRRICYARRHSMTNFQRIQFEGFNELTQEQANIWVGTVSIQLVNNAVQASTS
ncbi:hypothetical protein CMI47_22490 [Candidatus Pacearchaeota archaeon]|nr:hypothetical protein [Candidatus Pacearchaeota archaeon]|tara:strand:- start:109 stop:552 length:444 start_codon:yes stop_codon:yes gene_type:complete